MKNWRLVSRWVLPAAVCLVSASSLLVPGAAAARHMGQTQKAINLAYFRAQVTKFSAKPSFIPPGPAFNARAAVKGKTLFTIPASSAVPFVTTISNNMAAVASLVGLKYKVWTNQGQPSQWSQGMQAAINQKVSSIDLLAGIDPAVLEPQIQAAKRAGIGTVVSHLYDLNQPSAPNLAAVVNIPYNQAGRLLADWAILKTRGKLDAVVVTSNQVNSTAPMVAGIRSEAQKCGAGCKLSFVNVSIPEIATRIQPQVQSSLARDPKINYVIALYDSAEAPFAVAGIKAAHAEGRVKVVTFNGTPSVLKMVQDRNVVVIDIGENLKWIALGIMDQHMRLMAGLAPVKNEHIPLRIFSGANIAATGNPPRDSTGFGSSYVQGFYKIWGLK
jgi:ribose transport system substrate-binding protein